ncbi:MAG: hypothetical protein WBG32_01480 [Nodosilinea sp.]
MALEAMNLGAANYLFEVDCYPRRPLEQAELAALPAVDGRCPEG